MHVVAFTHILCVCVCVMGLHSINIISKNALSACGGSDDHGKTDGNQSAFLSHSSLLALTPMGYFMWIYGGCEGWRFSERFEEIYCGLFLVVPKNCNYTVWHTVCGLWSLQSKGKIELEQLQQHQHLSFSFSLCRSLTTFCCTFMTSAQRSWEIQWMLY